MQTFQSQIRDPQAPATPNQAGYLKSLLEKHVVPHAQILLDRLDAGNVTKGQASDYIALIKTMPVKPTVVSANPVTEVGIYEHGGLIYKVQRSKTSGHLYAKVSTYSIAELTALRAADPTAKIKVNYEYAPGAFSKIDAAHRMTVERAEELSALIANCLVCGRVLRAKESVARSIGPVCINKV